MPLKRIKFQGRDYPDYLLYLRNADFKSRSPAARFDPLAAITQKQAWQSSTSPSQEPLRKAIILDINSFKRPLQGGQEIAFINVLLDQGFRVFCKSRHQPVEVKKTASKKGEISLTQLAKQFERGINPTISSQISESDYGAIVEDYGISRDMMVLLDHKKYEETKETFYDDIYKETWQYHQKIVSDEDIKRDSHLRLQSGLNNFIISNFTNANEEQRIEIIKEAAKDMYQWDFAEFLEIFPDYKELVISELVTKTQPHEIEKLLAKLPLYAQDIILEFQKQGKEIPYHSRAFKQPLKHAPNQVMGLISLLDEQEQKFAKCHYLDYVIRFYKDNPDEISRIIEAAADQNNNQQINPRAIIELLKYGNPATIEQDLNLLCANVYPNDFFEDLRGSFDSDNDFVATDFADLLLYDKQNNGGKNIARFIEMTAWEHRVKNALELFKKNPDAFFANAHLKLPREQGVKEPISNLNIMTFNACLALADGNDELQKRIIDEFDKLGYFKLLKEKSRAFYTALRIAPKFCDLIADKTLTYISNPDEQRYIPKLLRKRPDVFKRFIKSENPKFGWDIKNILEAINDDNYYEDIVEDIFLAGIKISKALIEKAQESVRRGYTGMKDVAEKSFSAEMLHFIRFIPKKYRTDELLFKILKLIKENDPKKDAPMYDIELFLTLKEQNPQDNELEIVRKFIQSYANESDIRYNLMTNLSEYSTISSTTAYSLGDENNDVNFRNANSHPNRVNADNKPSFLYIASLKDRSELEKIIDKITKDGIKDSVLSIQIGDLEDLNLLNDLSVNFPNLISITLSKKHQDQKVSLTNKSISIFYEDIPYIKKEIFINNAVSNSRNSRSSEEEIEYDMRLAGEVLNNPAAPTNIRTDICDKHGFPKPYLGDYILISPKIS